MGVVVIGLGEECLWKGVLIGLREKGGKWMILCLVARCYPCDPARRPMTGCFFLLNRRHKA